MSIITVEQIKLYSGIYNTNDLDTITIGSAQERVEEYLGYKVESQQYVYQSKIVDNFLELDAPIISIESITLNDKPIDGYVIRRNALLFDDLLVGDIRIEYTGGYETIPSDIIEATIALAAKKKKSQGVAVNSSSFSMPDGVNTSFIPNNESSDYKYLAPISSKRIIKC